jgi:hypothetical protein
MVFDSAYLDLIIHASAYDLERMIHSTAISIPKLIMTFKVDFVILDCDEN